MMRDIRTFLIEVFSSFLFTLLLTPAADSANMVLNVPETAQEHSNWCWDASSNAVLEYYGTGVAQCDIAKWAWQRSDCCGNTTFAWSHACNQQNYMYGISGSVQDILSNWNVSSNATAALSQATSVSEINAGRPFVIRFEWTFGGSGHFLDGYGYEQDGQYLWYMDPWPGNGNIKSLYTWVVSATDHTWTNTLQITTNDRRMATTKLASSITPTSATLYGTVNADNLVTKVTFEFGTTTSYGNTVIADQSPATGILVTAVSKAITGLTPNTLYHFRVRTENSAGTFYGDDVTFSSLILPPTPPTNFIVE
jgi:hypothetical protein